MFTMDERTIGAAIRTRRQRVGLTVTAAAQRAGLSKGGLSKIERGQTSPPIATLIRVAEALGVELAELFVDRKAAPKYVLTRKGDGSIVTRDGSRFGYSYEALALDMPGKHAEPFILTIQPGDPVGEFRHGGHEFIYMLSGNLAFTVGEEEMVLKPGDSLYFNPTVVHTTRLIGKKPARFLCVFILDLPKPQATRRGRRAGATNDHD